MSGQGSSVFQRACADLRGIFHAAREVLTDREHAEFLQFAAILVAHEHAEQVDDEWREAA